jgi:hypothetical protein
MAATEISAKKNSNSFKFKLLELNQKDQQIQREFPLIIKGFLKVVMFSRTKKRS